MANPEKASMEVAEERRDTSARNGFNRTIYSVPVTVTVSIGSKRLSVSEILELQPESIVALNSRIDDPVDLCIDNKVIAKGELVEVGDGAIAVKIIEIVERAPYDNV